MWSVVELHGVRQLAAAAEWISRGKSMPLDLVVHFPRCQEEAISLLVALINRVSHRLRTLEISGHNGSLYRVATDWIEPAPMLQTLSTSYDVYEDEDGQGWCNCDDDPTDEIRTTCIRPPSSLPALRSLCISVYGDEWSTVPELHGCVSSSIQDLTLSFTGWGLADYASVMRLLECTPNLTSLRFKFAYGSSCEHENDTAECDGVVGLKPAHLPHLRSLHVTNSQSRPCFQWLRLLDTPHLRTCNINNSQAWQKELPQITRLGSGYSASGS
ncbi:hypothetical protein CALCODRAFT_510313 [Calocera cornea HHB12733]|uniref:F-box domain-containing protein n=1 Tax=Calocera cornea HHB12733 TaxID=1353952 RepID=A0A165EKU7_9BASI|nr:hypothetical protein CALCODRAFT_510313 [Calocera cornea HHB12733]